jgi:hypothetical protein
MCYVLGAGLDGECCRRPRGKPVSLIRSCAVEGMLTRQGIPRRAVSYSEVKALATGNPLRTDKARANAELARLERAERD